MLHFAHWEIVAYFYNSNLIYISNNLESKEVSIRKMSIADSRYCSPTFSFAQEEAMGAILATGEF